MFADVVTDLVDLTDAELDDYIRTCELERRATEAKLAAAIAVAESRGLNEADGHRSMSAYLRATCNWAGGEVARFRSAARTVDAHVEIGDAWLAGHLGSAQVTELSRTRTHRAARERFAEFVPTFVTHAEQLPFGEFRVVLQRFLLLADADGTLDEREAIERRTATVAEVGGELHLAASGGDALGVAEFVEIVRRFEQSEFHHDRRASETAIAAGDEPAPLRTGPQRRFDALLAMARAAAAHDDTVIGSEPLVSVLVDQTTMSTILARSGLGATESLTGETIDPFSGLPPPPTSSTTCSASPTPCSAGAAKPPPAHHCRSPTCSEPHCPAGSDGWCSAPNAGWSTSAAPAGSSPVPHATPPNSSTSPVTTPDV